MTKVRIKGAPSAHKESLMALVKEQPNTKIFGVWRARTRNWYVTQTWKRLRGKDEQTIWEAPTYYSQAGTDATVTNMESFLRNKGYFNTQVSSEVAFKGLRKKKAVVTYTVKKTEVYRINHVQRNIEDYDLYLLLNDDEPNSLIKEGAPFSSSSLVEERERVMKLLRDHGYYNFSREYLYFDLDSNLADKKINVYMGLKNPGYFERHKLFEIHSLEYTQSPGDSERVSVARGVERTGAANHYLDGLILDALRFKIGGLYSQAQIQETLKNLRKLRHYKYVDITFSTDSLEADTAWLDLKLVFTPDIRYQTQLQAEVITSEQNGAGLSFNGRMYGTAASFTFTDLNFSRRGIQMETRLAASSEVNPTQGTDVLSNNAFSLSHRYHFSRPFLGKWMPEKWLNQLEESTLSLNGFYEANPDFRRFTANFGAGYVLNKKNARHYILPVDFNLISTKIVSESFQSLLDTSGDLYLANLFDNHTIAGSRWAMYYTNKRHGSKKSYVEVTANMLEVAGSLFYLGSQVAGKEVVDDRATTYERTFLGMHFFQYLKGDYDLRYHINTFWNNQVVYRAFVGMVYPMGNTPNAVPIEKRYFAGGSNSVRGWGVRTLGPGSYRPAEGNEDYIYFRTGDIKIEGNFEYRVPVSSLIKMAVFADAGNIWNHPSNNFQVEGGDWQWDRFYKEFAVAGGLGVRFDFTYFVFRTDIGMPFRDPSVNGEGQDKWFPQEIYNWNNVGGMFQFNFGIGYPF